MATTTIGKRLLGKVAIVTGWFPVFQFSLPCLILTRPTGGSSGYGAGIAKRFANEGARVYVADLNVSGMEKLAANTSGITRIQMDVTKKSHWEQLSEQVLQEHGRLDCLVNNAGTTYHNKV